MFGKKKNNKKKTEGKAVPKVNRTTDLSGSKSKIKAPKTQSRPVADSKSKTRQSTPSVQAPKQATKPKKTQKPQIKHSDKYERGTDEGKPIIIKKIEPRRTNRKELRKVAKIGGYTVFDGPRAGKTFETPKEAAEYAADVLKKTGILYKIEKTDRQVSHTYKAENHSQKK